MNSLKAYKLKYIIFLIFLQIIDIFCIEYSKLISLLEEKDKSITKLKAEYTQIINFLDLNETYIIESSFIYIRPDKLKIELSSPTRQTIIVDTKTLCIFDHDTNTLYHANTQEYFNKNKNIFPIIFSEGKKYNLSDLAKKVGLKYITEEKDCYVLSTRYIKGKTYKDKKTGLRPNETRFIMWINKETLLPKKISMISEKYVVETELKNWETEFEINEQEFVIDKNLVNKIIELK